MSNKKKSSNATFVDPSDFVQEVDMANGETGELVNGQHTPENAWRPDTNGDPVGSEQRAEQDPVQLPKPRSARGNPRRLVVPPVVHPRRGCGSPRRT